MDDNFIKHGTQVTGLILSENETQSPVIIPLKAFNAEGEAEMSHVLCALKFAELANANIINASWSYIGVENEALRGAIESLRNKNILLVAAAGNDNVNISVSGIPYYPACFSAPGNLGLTNVITTTTVEKGQMCEQNYSSVHVDAGVTGRGNNCYFTSAFNNTPIRGSSYATAVLTGVIAAKYNTITISGSLKENVLANIFNNVQAQTGLQPYIRTGQVIEQ
jgi:hypothetical protein